MSNKTLGLPAQIYDYLLSVSVREPQILQRLRAETARLPMAMMQVAPEQGPPVAPRPGAAAQALSGNRRVHRV